MNSAKEIDIRTKIEQLCYATIKGITEFARSVSENENHPFYEWVIESFRKRLSYKLDLDVRENAPAISMGDNPANGWMGDGRD